MCVHLLVASTVFVSECVTVMEDHLSSIHSLFENSIGDEGAVAMSEAMKTMANLKSFK